MVARFCEISLNFFFTELLQCYFIICVYYLPHLETLYIIIYKQQLFHTSLLHFSNIIWKKNLLISTLNDSFELVH